MVAEKSEGTLQKSGKGTRDSIKTTMHKRDTIKNIANFQKVVDQSVPKASNLMQAEARKLNLSDIHYA